MLGFDVQPARKKPEGNKIDPSIIGGRPVNPSWCERANIHTEAAIRTDLRISGLARPPLRSRCGPKTNVDQAILIAVCRIGSQSKRNDTTTMKRDRPAAMKHPTYTRRDSMSIAVYMHQIGQTYQNSQERQGSNKRVPTSIILVDHLIRYTSQYQHEVSHFSRRRMTNRNGTKQHVAVQKLVRTCLPA